MAADATSRVLAQASLDAQALAELRETSDWGLLRRVENGDSAAFEELFLRYETRLVSYAARYVGSLDLARDVCQEVFLKLIHSPPRFRVSQSLAPWLFRVTRNLAIDKRRSRKFEIDDEQNEVPEPDSGEDPARTMMARDDTEVVRLLVEQLPSDLRDVVNLRIYGEVPFKDIARILNIPTGTALWRMHRALEILRRLWKEHHEQQM